MGLKQGRGGKILSSLSSPPLPLSLFRCFSRWWPRSMYLRVFVKKCLLCRLGSLGSAKHAKITINNFIMVYNPKYTRDQYHHHYYQICFGEETSRNHLRLITEATSNTNIFTSKRSAVGVLFEKNCWTTCLVAQQFFPYTPPL